MAAKVELQKFYTERTNAHNSFLVTTNIFREVVLGVLHWSDKFDKRRLVFEDNSNSKTLILKDISTIKQLINAESGIKRDKVYNMLPTAI